MERLPVAIAAIQLPRPRNRSQLGEGGGGWCSIDRRLKRMRAAKKNGDSKLILEERKPPLSSFYTFRTSKSCKWKRNEEVDNLWAVNRNIFILPCHDNFFEFPFSQEKGKFSCLKEKILLLNLSWIWKNTSRMIVNRDTWKGRSKWRSTQRKKI